MKKNAVVLGCGLVGATIVRDFAADGGFHVTAVDVSEENLSRLRALDGVDALKADLSNVSEVRSVVRDADLVLGALPSRFGFQTLQAVIEAGKPYCDISFMPEDALQLDALARQKGVTAVVDCGVSPGLSNLCVGHACAYLDEVHRASIYVGGLPKHPRWPFHYKAPFAPLDVIEEYTRPARLVENAAIVERPALSEPELIDVPGVGQLEAFNTDGLRSLLSTVRVPDMKEKTLRYPGHIELMRVLRETGFFGKQEIEVGRARVRPIDVTAKLVFPQWELEEGEEEFTYLRVVAEGTRGDRDMRLKYELYDEYDRASGTTSMARTTAFPCAIVGRMLASGAWNHVGVLPPERLAQQEGAFEAIAKALAERGVRLTWQEA